MPLIRWKERRNRARATLDQAWESGGHTPEDPGLRELYDTIPRAPIRLIALPLNKEVNHGGLLRLAEAFRLERVDLAPERDRAQDFSGNRGTRGWQPHRWIPAEQAVAEAKKEGYAIAALSLDEVAVPLTKAEWRFPLAIVLGSENDGMSEEIACLCDFTVAIPLYGLITSLNVGMAAALAVQSAVEAYSRANPCFQPVRHASRRLLGLNPIVYSPEGD